MVKRTCRACTAEYEALRDSLQDFRPDDTWHIEQQYRADSADVWRDCQARQAQHKLETSDIELRQQGIRRLRALLIEHVGEDQLRSMLIEMNRFLASRVRIRSRQQHRGLQPTLAWLVSGEAQHEIECLELGPLQAHFYRLVHGFEVGLVQRLTEMARALG